jgi:hypothetical protein
MTHGPIYLDPCPEGMWATCHDPTHLAVTRLCRTPDAERAFLHAHRVEPDAGWLARVDRARADLAREEVPA